MSCMRQLSALASAEQDWHIYRSLLWSKGRSKGRSAPHGTENRKQHMEMVFCPWIRDYYSKQPGNFYTIKQMGSALLTFK